MWAPSVFFEAEYKATVSCVGGGIGEDTSLDPLWEVAQRLTLSLEFHDTEFRLSGEHFYNDLSKNQHLNIWLADVSLIHKVGKWRFAASAINLFNKEQYRYTLYSAVQSYTSWIKLRPVNLWYLCNISGEKGLGWSQTCSFQVRTVLCVTESMRWAVSF